MKKFLSLLLAALMLCGCLTVATAEERETLTILIAEDTLITSYEDNAFTTYVEEGCNVNLEFVLLPATDADQKLQLMISSGEKLPDVICHGLNLSTVYAYAQAGAIIPLDEYYEKGLAVNVDAANEMYPEIDLFGQIRAADGHLYSIPRYFREINNVFSCRLFLNTQWLKNLNLEMPTTTEEFYQVLKAFKEQDPNGNGIADEIPMAGAWPSHTSNYNPINFMMNSFVQTNSSKNYFFVEDGKINLSYATDGWRKGLEYMNLLVEEGLLDPASFTQTSAQVSAVIANPEVCIIGCYPLQGQKADYLDEFDGIMPLKGPDGVQLARYNPDTANNQWFITADCKNPELAFKVGDFMFTEEAFRLCRVGEEGVSWVDAAPDAVPLLAGQDAQFDWLDAGAMWTTAQNATWRQKAPLFAWDGLNVQTLNENTAPREAKVSAYYPNLEAYKPAEGTYLTRALNYTEDEEFVIADIASTLQTYAIESAIRFITGDMDVETEWDAYVAELKNIGIDTYLEVSQAAYERQIAK